MIQRLLVLSGRIGTGKSTAAQAISAASEAPVVSTRTLLKTLTGLGDADRKALQEAGARFDGESKGRWVAKGLSQWEQKQNKAPRAAILDSARAEEQILALRESWPGAVVHVHLQAPESTRRDRYGARGETTDFVTASSDPIEVGVDSLAAIADVLIDTERNTPEDVTAILTGVARLGGSVTDRLVDVLVGGQWGSEGKGQIAAYLAPEYGLLVRVGGPNAGHSVFETDGPDKFFHLPSGTNRNPEASIAIGPGSVINPTELVKELNDNDVDSRRFSIDPQAMIIRDEDRAAEIELRSGIGSTAQGVGHATSRKVLRKIAKPPVELAKDCDVLATYVRPTIDVLSDAFRRRERVMLEGTQGTLLSLHHGSYPFVTSRDTTVAGCLAEAGIPPARLRRSVMVCRSYPIRVINPPGGTSGPMGREIDWDVVASRAGLDPEELKKAELSTKTKKLRRVAEFSWSDLRRAIALNAPTDLALTFVDYLGVSNRKARRFEQLSPEAREFTELMRRVAHAPVSLMAVEFSHQAIIDRREWQ